MDEFDFDALGDKISDLIEDAVNSNNFQKLNETISTEQNNAINLASFFFIGTLLFNSDKPSILPVFSCFYILSLFYMRTRKLLLK